jgi:asparagine synthase (glutamine-hydrolysing)
MKDYEYIFNRFVAGENTLYENISKVLPGHSMTLHQNGKIETEKWWDLKMKFKIKP